MRANPMMRPLAILAPLFFAGCAVGPDYKRPAADAPDAYRGQAAEGDRSIADLAWWDVYRDPQLKELIQSALADGYDARIAAARVGEARAIAAQVHGQRFPGLGYEANADRGRNAVLGNASLLAPPDVERIRRLPWRRVGARPLGPGPAAGRGRRARSTSRPRRGAGASSSAS